MTRYSLDTLKLTNTSWVWKYNKTINREHDDEIIQRCSMKEKQERKEKNRTALSLCSLTTTRRKLCPCPTWFSSTLLNNPSLTSVWREGRSGCFESGAVPSWSSRTTGVSQHLGLVVAQIIPLWETEDFGPGQDLLKHVQCGCLTLARLLWHKMVQQSPKWNSACDLDDSQWRLSSGRGYQTEQQPLISHQQTFPCVPGPDW